MGDPPALLPGGVSLGGQWRFAEGDLDGLALTCRDPILYIDEVEQGLSGQWMGFTRHPLTNGFRQGVPPRLVAIPIAKPTTKAGAINLSVWDQ